jgi:outer membrane protein OmpA-like peptidoglycan-associated protein
MKNYIQTLGALSLSVGLATLTGCGASQPPRELLDARAAYARAQAGPSPNVNPDALHEASESLKRAEQSFQSSADEKDTRTLAYVAERRSELVDVQARDALNSQQEHAAKTEFQSISQKRLLDAQAQLTTTNQRLAQAEQERMEANHRAREALDRLATAMKGSVKQETRGMVLTLPGQVLFATGKSTLLTSAQERLEQVAETLKQASDQKVMIEGHTDSTGSPERNQTLSEERANHVREFLISRGVPTDQIQAQGFGDTRPVAGNATAEDRANNRRVEIVIQPVSD